MRPRSPGIESDATWLMIDWNIQSRAHACQACGHAFADKEPYHTLLFDQKRGYQRQDVCASCWATQYSHGAADRKGFVSHWQGVFNVPPPARPDPILKETAESLLRRLLERNDPQQVAASYILAVMLERKRVLRVKAQAWRDGRRTFVYEHTKNGDLFTIPDPNLQLQQLETVQREVAGLLADRINPPADAPPETAHANTGAEAERLAIPPTPRTAPADLPPASGPQPA